MKKVWRRCPPTSELLASPVPQSTRVASPCLTRPRIELDSHRAILESPPNELDRHVGPFCIRHDALNRELFSCRRSSIHASTHRWSSFVLLPSTTRSSLLCVRAVTSVYWWAPESCLEKLQHIVIIPGLDRFVDGQTVPRPCSSCVAPSPLPSLSASLAANTLSAANDLLFSARSPFTPSTLTPRSPCRIRFFLNRHLRTGNLIFFRCSELRMVGPAIPFRLLHVDEINQSRPLTASPSSNPRTSCGVQNRRHSERNCSQPLPFPGHRLASWAH